MLENEEGLGHFLGGDKHGSAYQVPRGVNLSCWRLGDSTEMCTPGKRREKKIPFCSFKTYFGQLNS
jgi:hypothetical protein